jgi:hypothetical protein
MRLGAGGASERRAAGGVAASTTGRVDEIATVVYRKGALCPTLIILFRTVGEFSFTVGT